MKRGSPLRRKKPLQAKPGKSGSKTRRTKSRSKRKLDPVYLGDVRAMDCCAPLYEGGKFFSVCIGGVQAHHAGLRPLGRKADDDTAIPLCTRHHGEWHSGYGVFKGWTRAQRRDWADERIAETRRALGRET